VGNDLSSRSLLKWLFLYSSLPRRVLSPDISKICKRGLEILEASKDYSLEELSELFFVVAKASVFTPLAGVELSGLDLRRCVTY
jgi:hypothetical protein